ncbi:SURF1 family protein [Massilia brevitalea]|uniref:SURF1 family protein n=1 Tax=Massilia brevitalea TaxID=442526 RepID=UPI0027382727|nr:SURF1 family protein [Massilia brevitalea]
MGLRFRFRGIPFVATVVVVGVGIALGNWQVRRAGEKVAIAAQLHERGMQAPIVLGGGGGVRQDDRVGSRAHPTYRRIQVTGEFVRSWPVFLDNRPHAGRAGFYLAMPFRIAGSDRHVLVLRGWLPRDPREYGRLPEYATPQGTTTVEGVVVDKAGHVMQLGTAAALKPGTIVQNLEVMDVARASGLRLEPFFVQQTGPQVAGDPIVRDWPAPDTGIDKHRGYAVQWYALAAMAALFFVITGFRSGRKQVE